MLTMNDLLTIGGIDPKSVLLLRHRVEGLDLLNLWRNDRLRLETYQSR